MSIFDVIKYPIGEFFVTEEEFDALPWEIQNKATAQFDDLRAIEVKKTDDSGYAMLMFYRRPDQIPKGSDFVYTSLQLREFILEELKNL